MTPVRLLVIGFLLFLGSAWSFLCMWAGADLGCQRCDCKYRLLEGPMDCRWPAWWGLAFEVLFVLSLVAAGWAAAKWWKGRPGE